MIQTEAEKLFVVNRKWRQNKLESKMRRANKLSMRAVQQQQQNKLWRRQAVAAAAPLKRRQRRQRRGKREEKEDTPERNFWREPYPGGTDTVRES